jgi:NAD(P)-dependent dehydrogenase (short-subunit alcohol dehydrogenase family)
MGVEIRLDVTDRDADFAAVKLARDCFGRLDVIVNNAGYGQFGMVEEISEAEIRAQLETNLLGALWVTQAALPYLREQGRFPGRRATGYRQHYERARCRHRRGGGP